MKIYYKEGWVILRLMFTSGGETLSPKALTGWTGDSAEWLSAVSKPHTGGSQIIQLQHVLRCLPRQHKHYLHEPSVHFRVSITLFAMTRVGWQLYDSTMGDRCTSPLQLQPLGLKNTQTKNMTCKKWEPVYSFNLHAYFSVWNNEWWAFLSLTEQQVCQNIPSHI